MVRTKQASPKAAPTTTTTTTKGGVSKTNQGPRLYRPAPVARRQIRPYLDGIDLELINVVRATIVTNLKKMEQAGTFPTGSKRQENVLKLADDVEYCETSKILTEGDNDLELELDDLDDEQKMDDLLGNDVPYSIQRQQLESTLKERSLGTEIGMDENSPPENEIFSGDGKPQFVKIDFRSVLKDAVQRKGDMEGDAMLF